MKNNTSAAISFTCIIEQKNLSFFSDLHCVLYSSVGNKSNRDKSSEILSNNVTCTYKQLNVIAKNNQLEVLKYVYRMDFSLHLNGNYYHNNIIIWLLACYFGLRALNL